MQKREEQSVGTNSFCWHAKWRKRCLVHALISIAVLTGGLFTISFAGFTYGAILAEPAWALDERPILYFPKEVEVGEDEVLLGQIATITAKEEQKQIILEYLKDKSVARSPRSRASTEIDGKVVLEALEDVGLGNDDVAYIIPRKIKVTRRMRDLTLEEVSKAVSDLLKKEEPTKELSDLRYPKTVVPEGDLIISTKRIVGLENDRTFFNLTLGKGGEWGSIDVSAHTVEWREVTVASRDLLKGDNVFESDLVLARVKATSIPSDYVGNMAEIVGKRLRYRLQKGAIFRKNSIELPPLVKRGRQVMMNLEQGLFKATAVGIALEDGVFGQQISLRNSSSKAVVRGVVIDEKTVRIPSGQD